MREIKFFLKFGQKDHMESFAQGGFYYSNATTFWNIEDELHIKGQGDNLEGSSKLFAQHIAIQQYGQNSASELGKSVGIVRLESAKYIPVFCLYSVFEDECAEMPDGELDIKLTETTKRMIKEHFPRADSVAIVHNPEMFLFDIEKTFNQDIKHELVHYFHIYNGLLPPDGERAMDMEYMMYLTQDVPARPTIRGPQYIFSADYVYRILFCKDVFFSNEREYRIILPKETITKGKMYKVKLTEKLDVKDLNTFLLKH